MGEEDTRPILKLIFQQMVAKPPDYSTPWIVEIQYSDGTIGLKEALNLSFLIGEFGRFPDSYQVTRDRVKVETGGFISPEELLALLELNRGAEGLTVSGCYLVNHDLSKTFIEDRQRQFRDRYGYDPVWAQWPEGIQLEKLEAKDTDFSGSDMSFANFEGANLTLANFTATKLVSANLDRTILNCADLGKADLTGASVSWAKAVGTRFNSFGVPAIIDGTRIYATDVQKADMSRVKLNLVVGLDRQTSFKESRLRGARLEGMNLDVLGKGALSQVELLDAVLDRTQIRRDQLGLEIGEEISAESSAYCSEKDAKNGKVSTIERYERATLVYRALKVNFETIGRSEDASWAHLKEREMIRKRSVLQIKEHKSPRLAMLLFWDLLIWATSGYGEKPGRPILTSTFVLAVFAFYFRLAGRSEEGKFDSAESVLHSGASFFTMSFGGIEPVGFATQFATVIEAGIGILLIGLFLWSLGNHVRR